MNISYLDISEAGYRLSFQKEDSNWEGLKELDILQWPEGEIYIEKYGRNILVKGQISARIRFSCSRCLEAFSFPINLSFEQSLRPREMADQTERETRDVELRAEDLEFNYFDGDLIQVDRVIEEQIHLSLSMKPLCKEDCRGLCARCGANKNTEPCECDQVRKESPFDVLKNIIT